MIVSGDLGCTMQRFFPNDNSNPPPPPGALLSESSPQILDTPLQRQDADENSIFNVFSGVMTQDLFGLCLQEEVRQDKLQRCVPERVSNAWTGRFLVGESPTHQGEHRSLTRIITSEEFYPFPLTDLAIEALLSAFPDNTARNKTSPHANYVRRVAVVELWS
ncbi:hypothetical protein J6590_010854 [Homalodisca vitripennis]|nr:hypothetical protein J6590_010854 [Homalodisca vitripennis]